MTSCLSLLGTVLFIFDIRRPSLPYGKFAALFIYQAWVILNLTQTHLNFKQKLWPSGRALGSRLDGCGFHPRPMLDGSGVKAMPGSIPAPNSGSL
jgi:hypothetical protein